MGRPMWMVWLSFDGDGVPTAHTSKEGALAAATGPLDWVYRVDTMTEMKRPQVERAPEAPPVTAPCPTSASTK